MALLLLRRNFRGVASRADGLDSVAGLVGVAWLTLVVGLRWQLRTKTVDTAVAPKVAPMDETPGGVATIRTPGRVRPRAGASWWPYSLAGAPGRDELREAVALTAVPYYTWGNREPGAMRIWVPTA